MSAPKPPLCAIVLAGGASSRMGRDKAFVEVEGETLAARTARIVAEVCDVVVVVGAPGRALPALHDGVTTTSDDLRFAGPLAGLAAGLSLVPSSSSSHVLLVGVDFPRLREEPLRALLELAPVGRAVASVRGDALEPLPSWLPVDRLRGALVASRLDRSLRALLRDLDVSAVTLAELLARSPALATSDPELDSLRDADDEATLGALLRTAE